MDYLVHLLAVNNTVMKIPALRKGFDDLLMTAMRALPHDKRKSILFHSSKIGQASARSPRFPYR
jgi:hypothetical protein